MGLMFNPWLELAKLALWLETVAIDRHSPSLIITGPPD